jgi:hypothetical protein
MTRVRLANTPHDGEYELVSFEEGWPADRNQRFVLRSDDGRVVELDHVSPHDGVAIVEVRCDDCRQWVDHAGPSPDGTRWRCYAGYGGEECPDEP